jgi:tRNA (mo5U34)-methyltransferase
MKINMTDSELLETLRCKEWFYRFELPSGEVLPSRTPDHVADIHPTRLAMLMEALKPVTAKGWGGLSAIDIACHQGYFASHLARMGCREVLGVDARQEHVDDCTLIGRAYGLDNLRTLRSDLFNLDPDQVGQFDITLLFGLLYHVENPVGALRISRALTRKVCVVETQIAPGLTGYMDWGSYQYVKKIQGSFTVIDESEELHGPEMSVTGICLCPSLDALMWIMKKVGFARVELIAPPGNGYEQHRFGKRAVVAGYI